jgi:hypothetical protein
VAKLCGTSEELNGIIGTERRNARLHRSESSWPSQSRFTITAVTFNPRYLLLNCSHLGAWSVCTPDADSTMRKGLCAETLSVSHNDRDWLDVYRAAVMEFDRNKLPASIDVAEKAIHQRLRGLPIANSKDSEILLDGKDD